MNKQLQGIALILFGILWMLAAVVSPWVPVIDDITYPAFILGLSAGIAGLVFVSKSQRNNFCKKQRTRSRLAPRSSLLIPLL